LPEHHVATVAATELAMRHLGRPTPNTVLLGALTALTDVIHLSSVVKAINDKFSGVVAERNVTAAQSAHEEARAD
jgi:pyruvate ferredoxin oxidoreductase gamma subunit